MEVKRLVEEGASVNEIFSNGMTAVAAAAKNDHRRTVLTLLTLGADPNLGDHGQSALYHTCCVGTLRMAATLIQHGAKTEIAVGDARAETALHVTCERGYPALLRLLVQNGADTRRRSPKTRRLSNVAICCGRGDPYSAEILFRAGCDDAIHEVDEDGRTLMLHACMSRNLLTVKWVHEKGGSVNGVYCEDDSWMTPLSYLCLARPYRPSEGHDQEQGGLVLVKWMVEHGGADISGGPSCERPLLVAVGAENKELALLLVANGAVHDSEGTLQRNRFFKVDHRSGDCMDLRYDNPKRRLLLQYLLDATREHETFVRVLLLATVRETDGENMKRKQWQYVKRRTPCALWKLRGVEPALRLVVDFLGVFILKELRFVREACDFLKKYYEFRSRRVSIYWRDRRRKKALGRVVMGSVL